MTNNLKQVKNNGAGFPSCSALLLFLFFTASSCGFLFRCFLNIVLIRFFDKKISTSNLLKVPILRWLRRLDLNQRPSGYEPDELPSCSTPRYIIINEFMFCPMRLIKYIMHSQKSQGLFNIFVKYRALVNISPNISKNM